MIITCYSYKGGVGRSMALANLAVIFAHAGFEVTMVDWDLEAPGLERFFPGTAEAEQRPGLIDMLHAYRQRAALPVESFRREELLELLDTIEPYLQWVALPDAPATASGRLRLLSAGMRGEENFARYAAAVRDFDWTDFYASWDGDRFYEWLRTALLRPFDPPGPQAQEQSAGAAPYGQLVLIDSRTGVSEINSPPTLQLADVVVIFYAPNSQNLTGALRMARRFRTAELNALRAQHGREPIETLVIPSRVETSESTLLDDFQQRFTDATVEALGGAESSFDHRRAWDFAVPYVTRFAYDEETVVFGPQAGTPGPREMAEAYYRLSLMLASLHSARAYRQVLETIRHQQRSPGFDPGLVLLQPEIQLQDYLSRLAARSNILSLRTLAGTGQAALTVGLSSLYVAQTWLPYQPEGWPLRQRGRPISELFADDRRLLVLGDPGAGKTTLSAFLALGVAQAALRDEEPDPRLPVALRTWQRASRLVPILVTLRDLAAWLDGAPLAAATVGRFWKWSRGPGLLPDGLSEGQVALLERLAGEGRVLWLFDGLDEVFPGSQAENRKWVEQLIEALAGRYPACRFLVTCRLTEYRRSRPFGDAWPKVNLGPFNREDQGQFIRRFIDALQSTGQRQEPADGYAQTLAGLIQSNENLHTLAATPLLLAMLTLVYVQQGRLPRERSTLYEQSLEQLLYRWRPPTVERLLKGRYGLQDWDIADTGRLLDQLAYTCYAAGVRRAVDLLSHGQAVAVVYRFIEQRAPGSATRELAGEICERLSELSNGIFVGTADRGYRFLHSTFREYLAARLLVSDDEYWPETESRLVDRVVARAHEGAHWHEVLVMAAGYLSARNTTRSVLSIVRALRRDDQLLAARMLIEAQPERVDRASASDLASALASQLSLSLDVSEPRSVAEAAALGSAIERLGDPRPGVRKPGPVWCLVGPGRTFLGSIAENPETYDGSATILPATLPYELVPGSSIDASQIASEPVKYRPRLLRRLSARLRRRRVQAPPPTRFPKLLLRSYKAFKIARYPVTNAQWRHFMEGGGYSDAALWPGRASQWLHSLEAREPAFWHDPRFNGESQPVVGICWYEAAAYCRWLSARLGYQVFLPTETQWEAAARGGRVKAPPPDVRRLPKVYPWGLTWDDRRANTEESGLGFSLPVGMIPAGRSDCGAEDLVGNVLEWTATPFALYDPREDPGPIVELPAEDGGAEPLIVVRGGSWNRPRSFARCNAREGVAADWRQIDLGLRLAAFGDGPLVWEE